MSHSHSLWDWPIEDSGPPTQRAEHQPHAPALASRAVGYLDLFRGSSDERVARQYIKALRELGETRRLEFDAPSRLLITYDENGHRAQVRFIGNLAREIRSAGEDTRAAIYRRYATSSIGDAKHDGDAQTYDLVKPRLRVLLKDSSYPDYIALVNSLDLPDGKQSPLVFERLTGNIIACCIEEGVHSLRFVTESDLVGWGVNSTTALADAKENVCRLPYQISDPTPTRYVLNDDSFIASRFVNPRMFDEIAIKGELVAVIPDRDTFFVADSADLQTVACLALLAKQQLEDGERVITAQPFVLREGNWQVYEPPEAIRSVFSNVALQFRASNWADFKSALEKELMHRGHDIFVASLTVREEPGIEIHHSMAVWSKGVDTILPVVDRVYFHDDDLDATRVAVWANVAQVMSTAMRREAGLPERYRVRSFPNAEQFVAMGARIL